MTQTTRGKSGIAIRAVYLLIGWLMVALGLIGAFLPVMPTTVFIILAAGCFARSSPRLEHWLLNHSRFGPALSAWRKDRAIPKRAKMLACLGMGAGFFLFILSAWPDWPLALIVACFLLSSAGWTITRPDAR